MRNKDAGLAEFSQKYNYFSEEHPIIAKVTDKAEDFALTVDVIKTLKGLSFDEALTKILAYRQLKAGDELTLVGEPYVVDKVFDLKGGMPAFGLLSKEKKRDAPSHLPGDRAHAIFQSRQDVDLQRFRSQGGRLSDFPAGAADDPRLAHRASACQSDGF